MTFWCGSGSADPCLWLMDPDPGIFITDLKDANKKQIFKKSFHAYYFLKVYLHHFSKIKSKRRHKRVGLKFFLQFMHIFSMFFNISENCSIPLSTNKHKFCVIPILNFLNEVTLALPASANYELERAKTVHFENGYKLSFSVWFQMKFHRLKNGAPYCTALATIM